MIISNLKVLNYKNLLELNINFCNGINCLTGDNGAGKTNILDAIHYLSFCKSFINSSDNQNIQHKKDFFSIKGIYKKNDNTTDNLLCSLKKGQKKTIKLNDKEYNRLTDHIGLYPLVIISPSDHDLIYGGSDERRKFIDRFLSQFNRKYLEALVYYNKALLQRNSLLKKFAETGRPDPYSLEIWEQPLIKNGTFIHQTRKEFLLEYMPLFIEYYKNISEDAENVSINYNSQLISDDFETLLSESYEKDIALKYTTCGIHKDDFVFNINNYPIKKAGSQGQQKTFIICLKLAQYIFTKKKTQIKPLLLFDDLFDKLDQSRVEQLIEIITGSEFGQIFITDTHKERVQDLFNKCKKDKHFLNIKNGDIE